MGSVYQGVWAAVWRDVRRGLKTEGLRRGRTSCDGGRIFQHRVKEFTETTERERERESVCVCVCTYVSRKPLHWAN
jgi:hypothetical protein